MAESTEQMETDLRSRVVALEQGAQAIVPRVMALEAWQHNQDLAEAKREANWTALIDRMNDRFSNLEVKIGEVAGTLKWIGKTIVGAVVLAILALVLKTGVPL